MNLDEFMILVKALKAVYTDLKFLPDKDAVKVWYSLLKDLPYRTLSLAAQKYMQTEKFPPTIADLRKKAAELTMPAQDDMSELEAWALVRKALGNSAYNAETEFEKLPAMCKKALGNAANLEEMAKMDIDTVNSVEQSHFIRNYRVACDRKREEAQIAPSVLQLINSMRLEGNGQGLLDEKGG